MAAVLRHCHHSGMAPEVLVMVLADRLLRTPDDQVRQQLEDDLRSDAVLSYVSGRHSLLTDLHRYLDERRKTTPDGPEMGAILAAILAVQDALSRPQ